MTATRETFGNIPREAVIVFYWLTAAAMAIFAYGLWRRFKLWRQGAPGNLPSGKEIWTSLGRLLREGLGQARVRGRGADAPRSERRV